MTVYLPTAIVLRLWLCYQVKAYSSHKAEEVALDKLQMHQLAFLDYKRQRHTPLYG